MKSNHAYEWTIDLHGGTAARAEILSGRFSGTVDAALTEADVLECHAEFYVTQIVITRGRRVKAKKGQA